MKFFIYESELRDAKPIRDFRVLKQQTEDGWRAGEAYSKYLEVIGIKLPEETRSFVLAPWYRDPSNHDCPHDSWLKDVILKAGVREDDRSMNLSISVLGAFWDRILTFQYINICDCRIDFSGTQKANVGEWLVDEFDVTDSGLVTHEIQWINRVSGKLQLYPPWRIVAESVRLTISDHKQ